ncbi:MAG: hypothetical protein AAFX45_00155 [Pseudomonadota bacterium]
MTRRGLLSGIMAAGAWATAPRTVFALGAVGGTGPGWHAALGWTLVPLETDEHFTAWDDVWPRIRQGDLWLDRFRKPLLADAADLKLADAEASIAALLNARHADEMTAFLTRTYFHVSNNETLMRIIFPDGAFRVGRAAPAILEKWGYLDNEA